MMTPKRQRLLFVVFSVASFSLAILLMLNAFRENIVFFYSPSELPQNAKTRSTAIRIGGLVEKGSVMHDADEAIRFRVTDGAVTLTVYYRGVLPNLFREGQGVVAEGALTPDGTFAARRILAKHDETYMPPEVAEALKKSGHWRGTLPGDKNP